jgi:hypothetical protein
MIANIILIIIIIAGTGITVTIRKIILSILYTKKFSSFSMFNVAPIYQRKNDNGKNIDYTNIMKEDF